MAEHLHLRDTPGASYQDDELGVVHRSGPEELLAALSLAEEGRIYDLNSGRWP